MNTGNWSEVVATYQIPSMLRLFVLHRAYVPLRVSVNVRILNVNDCAPSLQDLYGCGRDYDAGVHLESFRRAPAPPVHPVSSLWNGALLEAC